MRILTPVGLSRDGHRLLLVSDNGEEFAVTINRQFRAALRNDPHSSARLGQLELRMESTLVPREIQARIRAGASVEEVASAGNTTPEAILGFATPVLAERAWVAETALSASIRRTSASTTAPQGTLEQACNAYFSDHGLTPDQVEWDAWRREDGKWCVSASFSVAKKTAVAEFIYDQRGRYVIAGNSTAQTLCGITDTSAAAHPGRSIVDSKELGEDAIRLVHSQATLHPTSPRSPAVETDADHEITTELAVPLRSDNLGDNSGMRQAELPLPQSEEASADNTPYAEVSRPAAPDRPAPFTPRQGSKDPMDPVGETSPKPDRAGSKVRKGRRGRAAMPSWDEIMFGSGTGE